MDPNMLSLEKLRFESEKKPSRLSKVVPSAPLKEQRDTTTLYALSALKPRVARKLFVEEKDLTQ